MDVVADKLLAILMSFAILGQAYIVRRLVGTWLVPACLYGLLWFFCTVVPLVFLFNVPVNAMCMVYAFVACSVYSLTALPFPWRKAIAANRSRIGAQNFSSPFMLHTFYAMSAGATLALIISISEQGFTLSDILLNFFSVASQYIAKRYADEISVSVFSQLSFVLTYPAAVLGGFVLASAKTRRKKFLLIVVVFIPSLLALLVQGAKGNLFLVLSFFWGGILASKLDQGDTTLVRSFNPVKASIYFLIVFTLVVFSFLSRGLYDESDNNIIFQTLARYFVSYTSAHLYGFSDWFSYYTGAGSVMNYVADADTNGFYTFMSLFKAAGEQKVVPMGVYGEYFYYGQYIQSNIYTWYRGLITDFGLGGSLAFMFFFGAVSHLAFYRILAAKNNAMAVSFFVHLMGFFYSSYLISLLIWNSAYTSFFLVAVVLAINKWIYGNRRVSTSLSQPVV